jgi:wyosine [tRNA(Phe)-imidazoG37] synthetase (radical SAM superfamily)
MGNTVYGPVPSWRFGRSLGIDPVPPPKRCTFNCIYCQLGPTRHPVRNLNSIQDMLPSAKQMCLDLDAYLMKIDVENLDVVTFSGTGEPTLNLQLGDMAIQLRSRFDIPLVLLTNGSLLTNKKVLESVAQLDIITVKFDAGDEATLQAINRPLIPFRHKQLMKSIRKLRQQTQATIALEVMLLETTSGISNLAGQNKEHLQERIKELASLVDLVQLYTPWRPPRDPSVKSVDVKRIKNFAGELSEIIGHTKFWIYGVHDARGKAAKWDSHHEFREEIVTMLQRRPCRLCDLALSLDTPIPGILRHIRQLMQDKIIIAQKYLDETYYFLKFGS